MASNYLTFSRMKWKQRSKRGPLHQATNSSRPVCKKGRVGDHFVFMFLRGIGEMYSVSDYFKNILFCRKLASGSKCSFAHTVDWSKDT
jgi:hypothetical protein